MMGSQYSDGHPPYPNAETVTGLDYHAVHRLACIPDVGSAMSYLIPSTYIYVVYIHSDPRFVTCKNS